MVSLVLPRLVIQRCVPPELPHEGLTVSAKDAGSFGAPVLARTIEAVRVRVHVLVELCAEILDDLCFASCLQPWNFVSTIWNCV